MEDKQIIGLYLARDENAISETAKKYGAFCHRVALNILSNDADAEECVNDTYLRAWNAIPPQRPDRLGVWLGKVTRNIAVNLWNKNRRIKRYGGMEQLLDELEDCIPSPKTVDRELEDRELAEAIGMWLSTLTRDDRVLFLRRYWNGERVDDLARECGMTAGRLAKRMYRLRQKLRAALEREGCVL